MKKRNMLLISLQCKLTGTLHLQYIRMHETKVIVHNTQLLLLTLKCKSGFKVMSNRLVLQLE